MRHKKARRGLGRDAAHRRAMLSNMVAALIEHGRIKTTDAKAREVRRIAEKMITKAKRVGGALTKSPDTRTAAESASLVHAKRTVLKTVRNREAVQRLFEEWAPRYIERPGGYTRRYKLGSRKGDNAPISLLEFVQEQDAQTPSA